MERDTRPIAVPDGGNAAVVQDLEESEHRPAADTRLSAAKVHRLPGTARKVGPMLAPKEAWKDNRRQDVVKDSTDRQTRNSRRRQSLWLMRTKQFCYEASVVGLRYVVSASASPFRRSVWVLLLIAGAAFTTFQIQDRIRYFLARPVSVNLRMKHAEQIRFPTVTICNENRMTYSSAVYYGK